MPIKGAMAEPIAAAPGAGKGVQVVVRRTFGIYERLNFTFHADLPNITEQVCGKFDQRVRPGYVLAKCGSPHCRICGEVQLLSHT